MEKRLKKAIIFFAAFIIISNNISFAVTSQDSANLQNKINQTKEQINDVNTNKTDTEKQVDELQNKIDEYQGAIDSLDDKLDSLEKDIETNQESIKKEQAEYDNNSELLNERLLTMYETGNVSYLDVLLSSKNLVDFISNYYLVTELTSYDLDLLNTMQKEKEQIEKANKALEADKNQTINLKNEKEAKTTELNNAVKDKQKYIGSLEGQEKQLQEDLSQFQEDKEEIDKRLQEIAQENAKKLADQAKNNNNNNSNTANNSSNSKSNNGNKNNVQNSNINGSSSETGNYICPIPGLGKGNITCGFYGYAGHGGADFGGNYGKPVVAAKSGVVVISETLKGNIANYDSNGNVIGSYRSYGEYIAILHDDGNITLYAHGKPGSRRVSVGQRVSQGQQIMNVGNTGNVKPRPSASNHTAGAHLHFEIRVNGSQRVDPTKYLK